MGFRSSTPIFSKMSRNGSSNEFNPKMSHLSSWHLSHPRKMEKSYNKRSMVSVLLFLKQRLNFNKKNEVFYRYTFIMMPFKMILQLSTKHCKRIYIRPFEACRGKLMILENLYNKVIQYVHSHTQ
ncbi:hypothetical protein HHI36_004106 [Cryptolaemus montrouzieri]|uniref:Uncharacterized protein n=1 Tax=Cryptolaemus montrouzieri TaxID=559131 RepID=A0ABD2NQ76_9CUCU